MDALAAAEAWVDGWARGWREHDAETIAALYADDALYLSQPFRDPHRGRGGVIAYAEEAFELEDAVEFWFGTPVAAGDRAAVEYWAIFRSHDRDLTLAGTTMLRFGSDGLVSEHRDYWAMAEGRSEPPDGWGPATAIGRRG